MAELVRLLPQSEANPIDTRFSESRSSLVQVLYQRYGKPRGTPPARASHQARKDVVRIPSTTVPLLKKLYGSRLLIVYLPESTTRTGSRVTRKEKDLEQACNKNGVPYASCHKEFIQMRNRFVYPKGFHNTLPGEGHLNQAGHRVMAEIMWGLIKGAQSSRKIDQVDQTQNQE